MSVEGGTFSYMGSAARETEREGGTSMVSVPNNTYLSILFLFFLHFSPCCLCWTGISRTQLIGSKRPQIALW